MSGKGRDFAALSRASSIGFTIVICTVAPCLFGVWLDRVSGLAPLFMLLFLLLGIGAAVFSVCRLAADLQRRWDEESKK